MSSDAVPRPNDLSLCHQIIDEQQSTIDQLQRELAQAKHFVEQLLRSRYGPRSERVDPNQLSMFDARDSDDSAPVPIATAEDPDPLLVREHLRRGGGRGRLPDHLPREVVDHDLAEVEKLCPCCGETRRRIGCETSEQLEFVPAVLKVIEHRRWKYACRRCEEQVIIAPVPDKPIAKGLPGPGLLSSVVVSKYADHLPLYRLEDVFARSGVELSRSTLCRWAMQAAAILELVYQAMIARVRASDSIHTDDTPVPVLDASLPKTRTARFWVYCGDWRNPFTVYDYTTSRKRDGPVEFLKSFEGYLHADAFAGYDGIYAAGSVKQVLCWAHARRKFYDARTVQPDVAHVALAFMARLYRVERDAKELMDPDGLDSEQAWLTWHGQRLELRQQHSLPLLAEFRQWLQATEHIVLPKSPIGQALQYVLPRWDGLVRYCENGALSIDNNLSERSVRPVAIGRKNYLFMGSDNGGKAAAILYSIMASAKANQVEPFAYVRDLLSQLSGCSPPAVAKLLPDAWLATHPESRRCWSR
jgi:transposase